MSARGRSVADLRSQHDRPFLRASGSRLGKVRAGDRCQLRIDQSELGAEHLTTSRRAVAFPMGSRMHSSARDAVR